jgi:hypothetical protein
LAKTKECHSVFLPGWPDFFTWLAGISYLVGRILCCKLLKFQPEKSLTVITDITGVICADPAGAKTHPINPIEKEPNQKKGGPKWTIKTPATFAAN